MFLQYLANWGPFRIDALGLVTMLGAQEMDTAVGRLTSSWVTDWLPFFSAYTVAGDQFTQPLPGFVLYNLTDGIVATDVSSWLTRWLLTEPITYTASVITLRAERPVPSPGYLRALSMFFGATWLTVLVVLGFAQKDYWSVANSLAMAATVGSRQGMVRLLRHAYDLALKDISGEMKDQIKVFLTLPNGKAVTILGPRMAVIECLLTESKPRPSLYLGLRGICWAGFGVHVIALGMSTLFSQILAVVLLLSSTLLRVYGVGDNPSAIGLCLSVELEKGDPTWTRRPAYVRLEMTTEEEESMVHWNLMPQKSNESWWQRCRDAVELRTAERSI